MIRNPILLHCGAAVAVTLAVSWLDIRPFGVLFLILLALWIYKTRCNAAIKIVLPQHINTKLLELHDRIVRMRTERPGFFCGIVSTCLALLAILGHMISGSSVVVFGLIAAGLVSTKYNFQILKVEDKEAFVWAEPPDHDVDEFLPEVNESNMFVLQRASDQAVINSTIADDEEKSEEVPSDLMIPDSIPEIDENSDSSSDDDLVLKPPITAAQTKKPEEIEFKSGYFNSSISTSSSDDDSLSKGLNFQNLTATDGKTPSQAQREQQLQSQIDAQSSSILPNIVSGIVQWSMGTQLMNLARSAQIPQAPSKKERHPADSSEESDFEMLDTDDLNNLEFER